MFGNLGEAKKYLGQAAKMLIGIPDYDNYVEHMKTNHPDKPYMTYTEFFRERQEARYGGSGEGGVRCCYRRDHDPDCRYPADRFPRRR